MANIFEAKMRVSSDTALPEHRWGEIQQYIKDNIAYDDYFEIWSEYEDDDGLSEVYQLQVKWSLDYIKEYLQTFAKDYDVQVTARGEEEAMGFFEVIEIDKAGNITRHEELSF